MLINQLKVFNKVCEYNSFTAAATALHMTQPSVSRIISDLESQLDTSLFERISHKLYITNSGILLLNYSTKIVELIDELKNTCSELEETGHTGHIRIGATGSIAQQFLPKCITEFKSLYPNVTTHVVIKNSTNTLNMLLNNELDILLTEGNINNSQVVKNILYYDKLIVLAPKSHWSSKKETVSLKEISNEPFLLKSTGTSFRDMFDKLLAENNLTLTPYWEGDNTMTLVNAVSQGIGLTVVPSFWSELPMFKPYVSIVNIPEFNIKRTYSVVYHKNKYLTKSMCNFINCAKKIINQSNIN